MFLPFGPTLWLQDFLKLMGLFRDFKDKERLRKEPLARHFRLNEVQATPNSFLQQKLPESPLPPLLSFLHFI